MIILGLGTNIGDRLAYLKAAIEHLKSILDITAISFIYESPALLKSGSPKEWDISYLNLAVMGETKLTSQELLTEIKSIEKKVGRQDRGIWAPREIDIDILAYGNLVIEEDDLQIPHKYLCERAFAILPFADIAPDWIYPADGKYKGKSAKEISTYLSLCNTQKTNYKI